MSADLTDDKSNIGSVMPWCRQAAIHYVKQWGWSRPVSPYGVTWINLELIDVYYFRFEITTT